MRRGGGLGYGGGVCGAEPPLTPHHSPQGAAKCERHYNGGRMRTDGDASGDAKDRVGDARDAISRPLVALKGLSSFSYTRTLKGKNASLASLPTRFASSDASRSAPTRPAGGQRSLTGGWPTPRNRPPLTPRHRSRYKAPMFHLATLRLPAQQVAPFQAPAARWLSPCGMTRVDGGEVPLSAGRPGDRLSVAGPRRPAPASGAACPWCGALPGQVHAATCRWGCA